MLPKNPIARAVTLALDLNHPARQTLSMAALAVDRGIRGALFSRLWRNAYDATRADERVSSHQH